MEINLNKLLLRQIKRHFGSADNVPDQLKGILEDINNTYENFEDSVRLTILNGNRLVKKQSVFFSLNALQKKIIEIPVNIPNTKGKCRLEAEIVYKGESIKSIREFDIE